VLSGFGRTRPDTAPGCPERLDWEFVKYVWTFGTFHRPIVVQRLAAFEGRLVRLTRPRDVRAFLDGFALSRAVEPGAG
jgi:hypothetical protein